MTIPEGKRQAINTHLMGIIAKARTELNNLKTQGADGLAEALEDIAANETKIRSILADPDEEWPSPVLSVYEVPLNVTSEEYWRCTADVTAHSAEEAKRKALGQEWDELHWHKNTGDNGVCDVSVDEGEGIRLREV